MKGRFLWRGRRVGFVARHGLWYTFTHNEAKGFLKRLFVFVVAFLLMPIADGCIGE